jgi:hypothetical protein
LRLTGQRLVLLAPQFLSGHGGIKSTTVSPDVLKQLGCSLISLSLTGGTKGKKTPDAVEQCITSGVLQSLNGLRRLVLSECPAYKSTAESLWAQIGQLTNLESLSVFCEKKVKSFSFLANLTKLSHLDFYDGGYSSMRLRDVAHLTNLTTLALDAVRVTSRVNNLPKLRDLYIRPELDSDDETDDDIDTSFVADRIRTHIELSLSDDVGRLVDDTTHRSRKDCYYWL